MPDIKTILNELDINQTMLKYCTQDVERCSLLIQRSNLKDMLINLLMKRNYHD